MRILLAIAAAFLVWSLAEVHTLADTIIIDVTALVTGAGVYLFFALFDSK